MERGERERRKAISGCQNELVTTVTSRAQSGLGFTGGCRIDHSVALPSMRNLEHSSTLSTLHPLWVIPRALTSQNFWLDLN